jgi:ABC-type dipeptide/oligopeptide/nickel transport system permease component
VQTITILAASIYVVLNLLADLATIAVTPRLRTEAR